MRTLTLDEFVGTCPFRLPTVIEMCAQQCPRARCTGKGATSGETPARMCGQMVYGQGACGYVLTSSGSCPRHGRRT